MWIFVLSSPFFILALVSQSYSHNLQMMIITLAALVYLSLALVHHYFDKTLKVEIVIEYVLIAALALIIFQSLLS